VGKIILKWILGCKDDSFTEVALLINYYSHDVDSWYDNQLMHIQSEIIDFGYDGV